LFPGIGHLAADNSGRPALVAEQLCAFFWKFDEDHEDHEDNEPLVG
jgi:hypothetical protein